MNRNLILAFLVAVASLNFVQASISPGTFSAHLNQRAPSIIKASFHQEGPAPSPMNFQFGLPIRYTAFKKLKCVAEVHADLTTDPLWRTYSIHMEASPALHNPSVSYIIGGVNMDHTEDLGKVEIICSFFLDTDVVVQGDQSLAYAWNHLETGTVFGSTTVEPNASFADSITSTFVGVESIFNIKNIQKSAKAKSMTIVNATSDHATNAGSIGFSPSGQHICDVISDGQKQPQSLFADVTPDKVTFSFDNPLNKAKDLTITCRNLKAEIDFNDRFRPALLMFSAGKKIGFSIPGESNDFRLPSM